MIKKAFSLVEILIGSAILVAAIIPLWGLMGSSHQQVMRSADEIKASQLTVEILEQIENYISIKDLPRKGDSAIEYKLTSGGFINIKEGTQKIHIGNFEDYFSPRLYLETTEEHYNCNATEEVGRVIKLTMLYNRKDVMGEDESEYVLRGFVCAKK